MRKQIQFYLNGQLELVENKNAFLTLANYLRYQKNLRGTKIVCAEGDCGACSVLLNSTEGGEFESVDSCIVFVFQVDGKHVVTIEGLQNEVQEAIVQHHGTQCGYCTPGFIVSATAALDKKNQLSQSEVVSELTGNLCRCTGYEGIIRAVKCTQTKVKTKKRFSEFKKELVNSELYIENEGQIFYAPINLKNALDFKSKNPDCRIISGATDLGVLSNKGRLTLQKVMSLERIEELNKIDNELSELAIGANVKLSDLIGLNSEWDQILLRFASPQIRTMGTLVGNVANGSPIGDNLPFLFVSEAKVELQSIRGKRMVEIQKFYKAYKQFDLQNDEFITSIIIPKNSDRLKLYKVSKRRDLDISSVSAAFRFQFENKKIKKSLVAFGGVGPLILMQNKVNQFLTGKDWSLSHLEQAAKMIEINPISDVRGSKEYRTKVCQNLFKKVYHEVSL